MLKPLKRNSEMVKLNGCKKDLVVEDFFVPLVNYYNADADHVRNPVSVYLYKIGFLLYLNRIK